MNDVVRTNESPAPAKGRPDTKMAWIPGGTFLMGSDAHYPEEAPAHRATVGAFWMDQYAVTNTDFRRFVDATGYVTLAERPANAADYPGAKPEMLLPASVMFKKATHPVDLGNHYNWWEYVQGANWRHPRGSRELAARSLEAPGGARRVRGCRGLREMGGQGAADRGRVGIRSPRRPRRRRVRLGQRIHAGGSPHGQHLARRIPVAEPARRRS